jgi:menaquinone-dependent protoporphyrinogen oxidase
MKVLIIYGSTEGQTRKIALYLKDEAEKEGHKVSVADATVDPPGPAGFDLVLIGASVHMHKYQSAVIHYVKTHLNILNKIRSGFFSVSMASATADAESLKELGEVTADFQKETSWVPSHIEQVAGALRYTQYDFFKKLIMRLIAKKHKGNTDTSSDHEYTDWYKLKVFLDTMLKS